jgi:multidrug efflux pump subunit AcrA (membrane-fusion protein)
VEPADAAQLRTGLTAEIHNVTITDSNTVNGQVRLISHRIDSTTRLVDVYVAVPGGCPLTLDTYVCGKIIESSRQALAVPRSAVLTDGVHYSVFGIKDGKAVKYIVTTGLEDNTQVEIITDQLKPGDQVVIEGNYELEDGAAVQAEDSR